MGSIAVILAWVLTILSLINFIRTAVEMGIDFFVHRYNADPTGILGILVIAFMFARFVYDIARNLRAQATEISHHLPLSE